MRQGLTAELIRYESVRYAATVTGASDGPTVVGAPASGGLYRGGDGQDDESYLPVGRRVVWNAPDFEVRTALRAHVLCSGTPRHDLLLRVCSPCLACAPVWQVPYPSLDAEVMVGQFILRLLFPGSEGLDPTTVRPARPLTTSETQEFLTQLLFRLLGDPSLSVKLACLRSMERVRPYAQPLLHFLATRLVSAWPLLTPLSRRLSRRAAAPSPVSCAFPPGSQHRQCPAVNPPDPWSHSAPRVRFQRRDGDRRDRRRAAGPGFCHGRLAAAGFDGRRVAPVTPVRAAGSVEVMPGRGVEHKVRGRGVACLLAYAATASS